jgi:alpha-tubulin suppressor-like RCC1 family protein
MRRISPLTVGISIGLLMLSTACGKSSPPAKAVVLSAGGNQTCVVQKDNAKCWGKNNAGQLGDGTNQDQNVPVAVTVLPDKLSTVGVGYLDACAVTSSGDIYCWGSPLADQFRISTQGGFAAVAVGSMHTCGLTSGGAVLCWGANNFGGLGDGSTETRTTPVEVIGLNSGVSSIAAGVDFSCAVQKGAAKCWGSNDAGQLGNQTYDSSPEPASVFGLESGIKIVATGVFHACALKSNGEVWCWGENMAGELGDGTNQNSLFPVQVIQLEGGMQAVTVGGSHTCALTGAGGVKCWGSNASGQLGDGSNIDRNSPVDVNGLSSGVVAITAGASHTCALLQSGAVQCWGSNENGQLGNGSNTDSNIPVDVRL